jgi:glycosyltransferase involved in cell wall biosynthesis
MKGVIFILAPYPQGHAPSQRFRFEQYISLWKEKGYGVEFYPFYSYKAWQTLYTKGQPIRKMFVVIAACLNRCSLLFRLRRADYIFIHREIAHVGPPFFEWFIAKVLRRKYVYDFDDAIWLPNYSATNASFHRIKAYWKIPYCIRWAHHVQAGNSYLADYAKQFNPSVEVVPTTIDMSYHRYDSKERQKSTLSIGWTGTHTTVRYLRDLIDVLQRLSERFEFQMLVISNEPPDFQLAGLHFIPWNKTTEMEDLAKIDIGVMPLEDDIWAKGKCGFKGLQYMALGIPTIMSPVGVNPSIVSDGVNGYLASTPDEWEQKLILLLESATLRKNMGECGKQTVIDKFSVEANSPNYLNLFKS